MREGENHRRSRGPSATDSDERTDPPAVAHGEPELAPLRAWVRLVLFALGAFLFLVGFILGPLPGVPFIVLVPLGIALLSLASDRLNRRLRTFVMHRWPKAWQRVQLVRAWLHRRLS